MKVAIITYCYSDKSNTVSGLRLESWARSLAQKGIDVTVFTRDWQWGDGSASLLLESAHYDKEIITCQDNIKIVYLPYKKNWYSQPPIFKKLVDNVMALEEDMHRKLISVNGLAQLINTCRQKNTHMLSVPVTHTQLYY